MSVSRTRTSVELTLIGDFDLHRGGTPVALAPTAQRLLAFLALKRQSVPRAHVSAALWSDSDPRHAGASLRSALWRLSPLGVVCSSTSRVWLDPRVHVDLHRILERSRTVLAADVRPVPLLALAHDLIEIGDDLLPGWDDDWVVVEREGLRQVRLQAMDHISEELVECGRCYDALEVALATTRTEPLRESAHRVLVRLHLRQGNVAEAIREYRRYSDLLMRELGSRPSPIMRELLLPFLTASPARAQA